MNQAPSIGAWSPFQWVLFVTAIFTAQVLIVWVLGDRGLKMIPQKPFATSISLEPDILRGQAGSELPDPALLALPSSSGLSGEAWLKFAPQQHELTQWADAPAWLALSNQVKTLGASIARFAAETRPPPLRIADQSLPWNSVTEPSIPPLPLPFRSRIEFDGLAILPATPIPELPSWQTNQLLGASVVRVAFDHTGKPFSCVLLGKSGLKEADDYALRLTTTLRFRPADPAQAGRPSDELLFGRLIFHWHTVSPPDPARVTSLPTP